MISLIKVSLNLWRIFITVKNNMVSFAQTKDTSELQKIAHELRKDVLEMLRLAGSGHIG
jgi:hypothetical protein